MTKLASMTKLAGLAFSLLLLTGCGSVEVTKTSKVAYAPTRVEDVEILMTKPDRKYIELATISTGQWKPSDTAQMHKSLRAKAAPMGADAVVLLNSGINDKGELWSTGMAIRYEGRR